jgi:hypothetical protein
MPQKSKSLTVPDSIQVRYHEIVALTDAMCQEKLNAEYALLSKELAATLARKRPSPLAGGQAKSWACGIVYTIGFVNFLFDKSQTPYLRADELCAWFGVAPNTGGNKARQIRDLLGVTQLDPQWTLPSMVDKNPMAWLVSVDGLVVDARSLPREMQEAAFRKGLIPYVPDDNK